MLNDIKLLLGERASNYTDAQISLFLRMTQQEIMDYCKVDSLDETLEMLATRIVVIKLNRLDTEGVTSQSFNGVSESYVNGYPEDIMGILRSKRRIKVL